MQEYLNVKPYLRDIAKYERITKKEEIELGKKIAGGDKQALEKLITSNLGLVIHIADRYVNKGISYEDLISEGNVGLTVAASRWNYKKNTKFNTYAYFWIKRHMLYALNSTLGQVRTPTNLASIANSFHGLLKSLEIKGSGKLSEQQIRKKFGKRYKNHPIDAILHKINTVYCDLNVPTSDGGNFERTCGPLRTESFLRELENRDGNEKLKTKILDIVSKIQHGDSIIELFGLGGTNQRGSRYIATKNGVSFQAVSGWRKKAFKRFRKYHKEKEFQDYLKVE